MTQHIPKVELHCHFEGTITPDLMCRMARRNGLDVPAKLIDEEGGYVWSSFLEFLTAYDGASSVIRTAQDYRDIAYEYLTSAAREGAIYVEMFTSPDHASEIGIGYVEMNAAIAAGIDDAEHDSGIIGRMIATCVRHLGPERALAVAEQVANNPHRYVVGFGMGGDEGQYTPIDFAPAYDVVFEAGLSCTVHAGEVQGAHSVEDALDALPVVRIGHGVRSIEDPELVARLVEEEITLEVCPGSNLALGLFESAVDHPLKGLMNAGCKITLGSDDPPFFRTTIGCEYDLAANTFGLSEADLRTFTKSGIEAAFADEDIKSILREKL